MKKPDTPLREPFLNQRQYSFATGLDVMATNNLVARGIVPVDQVISGRGRGFRMFTPLAAWLGRILNDSVKHHKMPLAEAAIIADVANRKATEGGYVDHWARSLMAGRQFVPAFMLVTWKDDCYNAQIINGDQRTGRPDFSSEVAVRFLSEHSLDPFTVIPLSALFEDVWHKCAPVLAAKTNE